MSVVTNLILISGGYRTGAHEAVNRWLEAETGQHGPVSCDDPRLPKGWYGGGKWLEVDIRIGAYNHLPLDALVDFLRTLEWDSQEGVHLVVQGQDDPNPRLIVIKPFDDGISDGRTASDSK